MKVKDLKVGELFVTENTMSRPKLKLKQGYLEIASLMVWVCREDVEAKILTDSQIITIRNKWGMTEEKFNDFKEALIRRYIKGTK